MRLIKIAFVACLLNIVTTASAQFVKTNNLLNNSSTWSGLRASYLPASIESDGVSVNYTGFQLGYIKSFNISTDIPLFLETGINVSYMTNHAMPNLLSLNVPINIGYKYVYDGAISVFPYVGLTSKAHLFGNYKGAGDNINIFDDRLEALGMKANRFQTGCQVGLTVSYYQYVAGISYGIDFNDFIKGGTFITPSITLGYNF